MVEYVEIRIFFCNSRKGRIQDLIFEGGHGGGYTKEGVMTN